MAFSMPPFCQGGVGVAEEGGNAEVMELVMARELGAVVEGNGAAPLRRQGSEDGGQGMGDGVGGFACGTGGEEEAGVALVESEAWPGRR